jgi:NADH-quinone oxidoreductase subunit J
MDVILFLVFAIIAVVCAINVVVQTHPISSALSLVGVMGALAVLYLLLGAEFIAAAQLIVYAGAIMVLFIFVIMLLNAGAEAKQGKSLIASVLGGPLLIALLLLVSYFVRHWFPSDNPLVKFGAFQGGTALSIGRALFTTYLLPFEITSLLVLIAIIGAVVLARKELD